MANSKSATKRIRQNELNRTRNRVHKTAMRTKIKQFLLTLENKDKDASAEALKVVVSRIDKTGKRGIIHKNTADRLKSRLTNRYNRTFA